MIWQILSGFTIGASLVAAYFVLKITTLNKTPSAPWFLIFSGLILRSVLLITSIQNILTPHEKIVTQNIMSLCWVIGFCWLFNLIMRK